MIYFDNGATSFPKPLAMIKAMEDSIAMEKQVEKLKKMVEAKQATEEQLAAAEKALTYLNEKTQQMFENGITKMQTVTLFWASSKTAFRSQ